jgi:hypothetical protein
MFGEMSALVSELNSSLSVCSLAKSSWKVTVAFYLRLMFYAYVERFDAMNERENILGLHDN